MLNAHGHATFNNIHGLTLSRSNKADITDLKTINLTVTNEFVLKSINEQFHKITTILCFQPVLIGHQRINIQYTAWFDRFIAHSLLILSTLLQQ